MNETFIRTELLLGAEAMERLGQCRVALFGVGGVGGHVMEALVRSGIGAIDLFDMDTVAESNLNRQVIATRPDIGRVKVEVARERILSINPDCRVEVHNCFYLPETRERFDFASYDYVVDAVDTVTAKIDLVLRAKETGTPVISSRGAGNKMNPALFEVADIYRTSVDPLARVMRRELKKRGIKKLKVVYSKEEPRKAWDPEELEKVRSMEAPDRRSIPASNAFTPSVAGLIIASEVIRDLTALH